MTLTEAVQLQLIISVTTLAGLFVTGWFALRTREHSKRTAAAAEQATEDAAVVRASLTTNNSGSHLKDWIDDLRAEMQGVRRDISGLNERLTASEQERAKVDSACQQGFQRQINEIRGDRWRDTPPAN